MANPVTDAMSETVLQTSILELARTLGWKAAHFHDSRRQIRPGVFVGDKDAAGFPDLVLARRGRLIFAELKTAAGKLSAGQAAWLGELEGAAEVYVWRPEQWRNGDIEKTLR